ncbi:hypothetical protein SPRG_09548 [Saprolegnia parasitica CBS 223.65]|uniref:Uncharacterized protein n=1 Tax=Saprolegnia parasitica (strain CBS 223.65) TaxID=695850 RepID=A0A067C292_SAPPC|nr:hypothetical protein SPRG_09548 [Saprolegnia parasitica CBS 223.65]KDO24904.1 hypothetical protein SPRG_09548 [Saprolegnia parasitica CBS 223.65]|eukprot:XP_012204364.1 hypothetical protein SPRG_09548 [Saprolegnia parasitica CBS 223.65]
MRTRPSTTSTANDPIAALEARIEVQARANAAELQELRAALRAIAPPDEASHAETALERENAELKAKLAVLERQHRELQTMFQEHLCGVQHAATTMAAKVNRLCEVNGNDDAAGPAVQAFDPPAVGKRPAAARASDGPMTAAKRPCRQRDSAVQDQEEAPTVPASEPPAAPLTDEARLRAGMDLTPALVDRFLKHLQVSRTKNGICIVTKRVCRILPASVLSSLMGSGTPPPLPAAYGGLLTGEIIVLPLFLENHWSVTMVFGFHNATSSPATIVFFDTFDSQHREAGIRTHVADFLAAVHHTTRSGAKKPLEFHHDYVKVPFQDSPSDSGLWMLRSVELTLRACSATRKISPHSLFATNFYNVTLEHWICDSVEQARDSIQDRRTAMIETLCCYN